MSEQKLVELAGRYNPFLQEFIHQHNASVGVSSPLHIFDLSNEQDLGRLQAEQYAVSTAIVPSCCQSLYPLASEWVDKTLQSRSADYRTLDQSQDFLLSRFVYGYGQAELQVQRGLCVVGKNDEDHEYEVHPLGDECLIPRFFHAVTIIADGLSRSTGSIDRAHSRLVFMPADNGLMYKLDGRLTAHYMPHVLAVMEVALPAGTGGPTSLWEKGVNLFTHGYPCHNLCLYSDRGEKGTRAKVTGRSSAIDIIKILQIKVNDAFADDLEKLLEDKE